MVCSCQLKNAARRLNKGDTWAKTGLSAGWVFAFSSQAGAEDWHFARFKQKGHR
ncbi:hypothetical protein KB20921_24140 [Edwardsiella ictaluri]|nr:hypothetical protein KH20906_23950 [Edwardsiella ictaluri]BEI03153.1 hypothetical protein KB20921_24140 [Edwardsiella ictaluri]BEI06614.1 hypothetical protein KH201010_24000 [Edwardsiella ictaluri]BEI10078.1 hypothetical protein STU22726_24090 [Edwardsiella ictaluri]BEI13557.1 hypothetical protein STU22816_24100 [Edwardsiella ictaluri]